MGKEQWYNDLKREVAMTLSKCLFGKGRRQHLLAQDKRRLGDIMRELDETFKQHGVDWKLTEG